MSDPLIDPSDLATVLNDGNINTVRAAAMIVDAQTLCETIIAAPMPPAAAVIVKRVAVRGYTSTTSTRGAQVAAGGSPFGGSQGAIGGIYLTRADRADLRRIAAAVAGTGSGGAFSVNLLGNYAEPALPIWDLNGDTIDIATS